MAKLDADHTTFREFVKQTKVFRVPQYQRPYCWRARGEGAEVARLLDDVMEQSRQFFPELAAGRHAPVGHFMGSVVFGEPTNLGPLDLSEYVVIDGQQRLTSLALLLSAVRDTLIPSDEAILRGQAPDGYTVEKAEEQRANIESFGLIHKTHKGEFKSLWVIPGESDEAEFESILRRRQVRTANSPIAAAYKYFVGKLAAGLAPDEHVEEEGEAGGVGEGAEGQQVRHAIRLDEMLRAVLDRVELVTIGNVTTENAFQIFETLNATGLHLEDVDLLRNAVFMLLRRRGAAVYQEVWRPMEQDLGDGLRGFYHAELIREGHNITKQQIYSAEMAHLARLRGDEAKVEARVRERAEHARLYKGLTECDEEGLGRFGRKFSAESRKRLTELKEWGAEPAMPLVLDAALRWERGGIGNAGFEAVVEAVMSMLVRRHVCAVPPNDLRPTVATVMQAIARKGDGEYVAEVMKELRKETRRWHDDATVLRHCSSTGLYRKKNQRYVFFILKRVAQALEGREYGHIVLGNKAGEFSIEHVLPQGKLTDTWKKDLAKWGEKRPDETWTLCRDLLGNLTLTAYNSALGLKSLREKKKFIRDNLRLEMSRTILGANSWARKDIEARSELLGRVILRLWPRED